MGNPPLLPGGITHAVAATAATEHLSRLEADKSRVYNTLPVRAAPDPAAVKVRWVVAGQVLRVTERHLGQDGRLYLFVGDGWVDACMESLGKAFIEECDIPEGETSEQPVYRVLAPEGATVYADALTTSDILCAVPEGELVDVVQRLRLPDGATRLQLLDGGWVCERMLRPSGSQSKKLLVPDESVPRLHGKLDGAGRCRTSGASASYFRVVAVEGLVVRAGMELSSPQVRTIPEGEVFIATARRLNRDHFMCLSVPGGWVTKHARGLHGALGELLVEHVDSKEVLQGSIPGGNGTWWSGGRAGTLWWMRVVDPEGLVVRRNPGFDSDVLCTLPFGAVIQATGERACEEGVLRVRLASGGWTSERRLNEDLNGEAAGSLRHVEPVEAPEGVRNAWYRVRADECLEVRQGPDDVSDVLWTLLPGEVFEVGDRTRSRLGRVYLFIEDVAGWVAERHPSTGADLVSETSAQPTEGHFWYRVVAPRGLAVTAGRCPSTTKVGCLPCGGLFEASLRARGDDGSLALHVGDGWVQARLPLVGGTSNMGLQLAVPARPPMGAGHFWYRVIDADGLLVRAGIELGTEAVWRLSCGTVFKASCRHRTQEGVVRLNMRDGWVSERATNSDFSPGVAVAEPADPPEGFTIASYKVVIADGAPVWTTTTPVRAHVRLALQGEVLLISERRRADGRLWLCTDTGWLCERAEGGDSAGALQVVEVDAPEGIGQFHYRVNAPGGVLVRAEVLPFSNVLRTVACGDILEVRERRRYPEPFIPSKYRQSVDICSHLMRLRISDGWVCERALAADDAPAELLVEPVSCPPPSDISSLPLRTPVSLSGVPPVGRSWHRVLDLDGLAIRQAPDNNCKVLRIVPCGELVEVRERQKGCQWALVAGGWAACERPPLEESDRGRASIGAAEPAPEGAGVFWYHVVAPLEGVATGRQAGHHNVRGPGALGAVGTIDYLQHMAHPHMAALSRPECLQNFVSLE